LQRYGIILETANISVEYFRTLTVILSLAHIHKVFYPCNRCHLATLSENQYVTCDNEVTRVTTNGDFALNIHSTLRHRGAEFLLFLRVSVFTKLLHAGCEDIPIQYSTPWNKSFLPMEQSVPPHGTNRKVPPSWGEIIDE